MRYPDTQTLRAVAILFILNSHLDNYYPIHYLATGGAIGNSIFFFLSGYGLCLSYRLKREAFVSWYTRRVARIYPSMWVALILLKAPLMAMKGQISAHSITTFVGYFFNPPFWFLQALLVYYLITFALLRAPVRKIIIVLISLTAAYVLVYLTWVDLTVWSIEKTPFDRIHYLIIFVFGILVAKKNSVSYSGLRDWVLLIVFVALMYSHKFLMYKGLYAEYQFVQQACLYPIVYFFLKVSNSRSLLSLVQRFKLFSEPIEFLSNNTLEIYIVHEILIYPVLGLKVAFPSNLIVFLLLTFVFSRIVKYIADLLRAQIGLR